MVLFFTGTGNSKYAADFIADKMGDNIISLNSIIKNNLPAKFQSENPFIMVAPIYAWRFPIVIEELLKKAEFYGSKEIYFVGTMASQTGNCDKYCEKLCKMKGMIYKGFCGVTMPNNYVISDVMPKEAEVKKVIKEAIPVLNYIVKKIKKGEKIKKADKTPFSFLMSGAVNSMFNRFMVSSKNFVVSDKCISCGKCKENCAVNNIEIENGKPIFGNKCINCFSCIHRCKVAAIDIKSKTINHGRYVCPNYDKDN